MSFFFTDTFHTFHTFSYILLWLVVHLWQPHLFFFFLVVHFMKKGDAYFSQFVIGHCKDALRWKGSTLNFNELIQITGGELWLILHWKLIGPGYQSDWSNSRLSNCLVTVWPSPRVSNRWQSLEWIAFVPRNSVKLCLRSIRARTCQSTWTHASSCTLSSENLPK